MGITTDAAPPSPYARLRFYYGWVILMVAALAMVGTLPGRTQGLGLITEPLLRDLDMAPVEYARINLWATLIGALFCIGVGRMQDKWGSRIVLSTVALALGGVVIGMSRAETDGLLFTFVTLTRGLGQSALSVVSLAMIGQWFRHRRLDLAMAVFALVMSMGFMIAFPVIGSVVTKSGWRVAWAGIGWALIVVLVPVTLLLVRRSPEAVGLRVAGLDTSTTREVSETPSTGYTLWEALRTPAFWVMAIASAFYGLVASGIGLFNESVLNERGFAAGTYYQTLVVTALTSLIGNFVGGFLTAKGNMNRLMAVAMALLMIGLAALPLVRTIPQVMTIAVVMGIAGGFVMVLFFSFWGRVYGRAHLGHIQGAAQTLTVVASAVGPLLLAESAARTGSYAFVFYLLAVLVGILAVASWVVRVPAEAAAV